jgi:hypothetical protein
VNLVIRVGCSLVAVAVLGFGATGTSQPRIRVTPASPTAGVKAAVTVRGKLTAPVVLRLTTPRHTAVQLRLRRVSRTLSRGAYTFAFPGTWRLTYRKTSRQVEVGPYPESSFVPLGASGCLPPSPANAITREARGSDSLWALLEGGEFGNQRAAVLDGIVGKATKIVWRMSGQGDLHLSAIAPSGETIAPAEVRPHDGSNWKRPGDEWGSYFTFLKPGCWQLHAERGNDVGDLWLIAHS